MNNKLLYIAAASVLVCSCSKSQQPPAPADSGTPLHVEVESPVVCNVDEDGRFSFGDTRSSSRAANDATLDNLSVWAYDGKGNLACSSYFGPDDLNSISVQEVLGPGYESGTFTLCLLGNFGNPRDNSALRAPSTLNGALNWTFDVSGYRDFDRFPMSGILSGVTASNIRLPLKRLMSEYRFHCEKAPDNPNDYEIRSFVLNNVNRSVRPFAEGYAATSTMSEHLTDRMSRGDLIKFNGNGEVTVYVSENMQGDLKADSITSFDRRTHDNLGEYGDLCTFFEISARVTERSANETKIYEDVRYRWYFGYGENIDKCNFDVPRNVIFNVAIKFDSDVVSRKEWIVVPEREIRLAIVSSEEILTGSTVAKSADLYCDGILVESGIGCDWSVEKGQEYVESRPDGLYGARQGKATVKATYNYNGSPIFTMKEIGVKNDYRYFFSEDADEYIDDEGFQGPTYVCDYFEEFYVTNRGARLPLAGNLTIVGADGGTVYDGGPSYGGILTGIRYTRYSWAGYLNSAYTWHFSTGGESLSVSGNDIVSEIKPQQVEIVNRSSSHQTIFGLYVPSGGTAGISIADLDPLVNYPISGKCTAVGNNGGYSKNVKISATVTERVFVYLGDTRIYLY